MVFFCNSRKKSNVDYSTVALKRFSGKLDSERKSAIDTILKVISYLNKQGI